MGLPSVYLITDCAVPPKVNSRDMINEKILITGFMFFSPFYNDSDCDFKDIGVFIGKMTVNENFIFSAEDFSFSVFVEE